MSTKEAIKKKTQSVPVEATPPKYKVILLNDDFTSMDFVVEILMGVFGHDMQKAVELMMQIHQVGKAVCGVYMYEIAEMKVFQVERAARANNYPLRAIIEEE